jgi:hypothetical protein
MLDLKPEGPISPIGQQNANLQPCGINLTRAACGHQTINRAVTYAVHTFSRNRNLIHLHYTSTGEYHVIEGASDGYPLCRLRDDFGLPEHVRRKLRAFEVENVSAWEVHNNNLCRIILMYVNYSTYGLPSVLIRISIASKSVKSRVLSFGLVRNAANPPFVCGFSST